MEAANAPTRTLAVSGLLTAAPKVWKPDNLGLVGVALPEAMAVAAQRVSQSAFGCSHESRAAREMNREGRD
jgi:hypothetical protein